MPINKHVHRAAVELDAVEAKIILDLLRVNLSATSVELNHVNSPAWLLQHSDWTMRAIEKKRDEVKRAVDVRVSLVQKLRTAIQCMEGSE